MSARVAKSDASWSEGSQNGSPASRSLFCASLQKEQAEKGGESRATRDPRPAREEAASVRLLL